MAQSNISLAGIMALSDWATGKRSAQQKAALEGQQAQTGYEKQATTSMQQQSEQSATNFAQQQDQQDEQRALRHYFDYGVHSPQFLNEFAHGDDGTPNNKWLAKEGLAGYAPEEEKDPTSGAVKALRFRKINKDATGNVSLGDYFMAPGQGTPGQPAEAPGGGTEEGVPAQPAQQGAQTPFELNAQHLAALKQHVYGPPKGEATAPGQVRGHYDQATGVWVTDIAVPDRMNNAYARYLLAMSGLGGTKPKTPEDIYAQVWTDPNALTKGAMAPEGYAFHQEYLQEVVAFRKANPGVKDPEAIYVGATRSLAQKDPNFAQMLQSRATLVQGKGGAQAFLKGVLGPQQGAATGAPGAEPAPEEAPKEPTNYSEFQAQQQAQEASKNRAEMARQSATVTKVLPNAYRRLDELHKNGATFENAIDQIVRELSEGYADPSTGFIPGKLPNPTQQKLLRQRLLEFVQPPATKPNVAGAAKPSAKPKAARGGVVAPMRDMEPGTGIPGTLSRPLQIRAGGFRPRSY